MVSQIATAPIVLLVHPGVPVNTGPELFKYMVANKGKLSTAPGASAQSSTYT
ncbi:MULTISPECIES: tripartite tricarboxylate transporter substrate-binding protein [Rhodanobacter]|uniref:tripartite tricarboxylate transporter substrate-binding protein n=1 Tax=Rhodanobacter TaxID=75309 RepID=UPI0004035492